MKTKTEELRRERVEQWKASGLRAEEFAASIGVNPRTLKNWKWLLGAEEARKRRAAEASKPAFLELVASRTIKGKSSLLRFSEQSELPAVGAATLELILKTGHRVNVPTQFDASALRRLVDVLEAR